MDFENRKRIKKKTNGQRRKRNEQTPIAPFFFGVLFFCWKFYGGDGISIGGADKKATMTKKKKINQSAFLWGATLIGVHETHLSANWRQINLKFLFFLVFFFFFFFFFIIFFVFFFAPYAKSGATHLDNNSNNSNNNSNNNNSNNNNSNNLVSVEDEQETRRNFDSSTKWNSMKWRQIVNNR